MKYLFILLLFSNFLYGQTPVMEYKVQMLSLSYIDNVKFKHFIKDYNCEIEHYITKEHKDVYRYIITPKENSLISAEKLLNEVSLYYKDSFIVKYINKKRNN